MPHTLQIVREINNDLRAYGQGFTDEQLLEVMRTEHDPVAYMRAYLSVFDGSRVAGPERLSRLLNS